MWNKLKVGKMLCMLLLSTLQINSTEYYGYRKPVPGQRPKQLHIQIVMSTISITT